MLNSDQGPVAGNKTSNSTFSPQGFMKYLRDISVEGVYTFEHSEFGDLRVLKEAEELFFTVVDVCKMVGIKDANTAVRNLQKKYQLIGEDQPTFLKRTLNDSNGRSQTYLLTTEESFYDLLMQSRKPVAIKVKKWVTRDILPAIRKHGLYAPSDMAAHFIKRPDALLITMQALKEEQDMRMALEEELRAAKPKLEMIAKFLKSEQTILVREFAKILSDNNFNIGQNRLYKLLRENKCVLKNSTEPSQYAINNGWLVWEQYPYETSNGLVNLAHITKITPRGQEYLIHKILNEPSYRKFRPRYAAS